MAFSETEETLASAPPLSPSVESRNGACLAIAVLMTYLAAPVTYVGVVQATLCDRLGANATLSNLPSAVFLFGGIAPLFLSAMVPHRLEKMVSTGCAVAMALSFGLTGSLLISPISTSAKIVAVIAQSSAVGILPVVEQVYLSQCLKR
ncbi:MAG: hypothetical protein EXQ58_00520 [Acidobacteria bacterium]|nr:hypothetical protein [Acidobacteriota bacterium]